MTNKLKLEEILEKFEESFPYKIFDDTLTEKAYFQLKDFIRKSCTEYARSVVPEVTKDFDMDGIEIINEIHNTISQDELSLGEEDTLNN